MQQLLSAVNYLLNAEVQRSVSPCAHQTATEHLDTMTRLQEEMEASFADLEKVEENVAARVGMSVEEVRRIAVDAVREELRATGQLALPFAGIPLGNA